MLTNYLEKILWENLDLYVSEPFITELICGAEYEIALDEFYTSEIQESWENQGTCMKYGTGKMGFMVVVTTHIAFILKMAVQGVKGQHLLRETFVFVLMRYVVGP